MNLFIYVISTIHLCNLKTILTVFWCFTSSVLWQVYSILTTLTSIFFVVRNLFDPASFLLSSELYISPTMSPTIITIPIYVRLMVDGHLFEELLQTCFIVSITMLEIINNHLCFPSAWTCMNHSHLWVFSYRSLVLTSLYLLIYLSSNHYINYYIPRLNLICYDHFIIISFYITLSFMCMKIMPLWTSYYDTFLWLFPLYNFLHVFSKYWIIIEIPIMRQYPLLDEI